MGLKRRPAGPYKPGRILSENEKTLLNYQGEDRIVSSSEMERTLEESGGSIVRVRSLIPSLDAMIKDFQGGELIPISGPPKNGKTLLAQTLTVNFNTQGHRPLWFTYEVPVRQFLEQFPGAHKIWLPRRMKAGNLTWVKERIVESDLKNKSKIVFIDNLHHLFNLSNLARANASLEIGNVIRQLKQLAVERNLIIFLLAHGTKGSSESELTFENIRDSSFIAQESDCVLMIKRTPENAENASRLQVEFHRRTGVPRKAVDLIKFKGLLVEKSQLIPTAKAIRGARVCTGRQKPDRRKRDESQEDDSEKEEDSGEDMFLPVNIVMIPNVLKNYPNWVCWRLKKVGEKRKKVPISPTTGRKAKTNDPETWGTFSEAVTYWKAHKPEIKGIGFVFTNSPFCGVDLDNCRDPQTGEIQKWAGKIVAEMKSYTELSPSGTGIHNLIKGHLPPEGRRKGDIEMLGRNQYFTITGQHLEGTPIKIKKRGKRIKELHSRIFGTLDQKTGSQQSWPQYSRDLRDSDLIRKAKQAKNGHVFSQLWAGDWSGHKSRSEADFHLCRILAFWSQEDPVTIDRLFRQSGLMREKWDEPRGERTWGQITIQRAIKKTREA